MHRIAAVFLVAVFLAAVVAGPVGAQSDAVLSQVSNGVTLKGAGLAGSGYPARPLQVVAPGSTLELPEKTRAVVICSDDRAVVLTGPRKWQLGTGSCQDGRSVTPGTYASLRPSPGVARDFVGSLLTEARSRSDDKNGKVPVLVRPRSPQFRTVDVGEPSPAVAWTAVRRAQSYDLGLKRGDGRVETVTVAAPKCLPDRYTEPLETCTLDWPFSPLSPGEEVELTVEASTPSDTDRQHRETDPSKLRRVDTGTKRQVDQRLSRLAAGDLPEATRGLLSAAIYSDAGLFNEAAEALRVAMEDPQATVAIRLADLYLGLGQLRAALNCYTWAEQLLPPTGEDGISAALHLGRGRLYARKEDGFLASQELEKAAQHFRRAGNDAGAEIAKAEAELASRSQ